MIKRVFNCLKLNPCLARHPLLFKEKGKAEGKATGRG